MIRRLLNAAEDNGANDCNSGRCNARKNECSHRPTLFYFVISGVSNARAANRGAGVLHLHGLRIQRPPSLARRCGARYGEQTYTKSKNDRRADPRGEMPPSHCGLPPKDENAPGLSNACRGSLLAVLSQLLVTLPPVLPKLPGGKQRNDCAENEMPVPERASFCVTKDEW